MDLCSFNDDLNAEDVDKVFQAVESRMQRSKYLEVLSKYFGHGQFRPLQANVIEAIVEQKRDVCAVMSTGYGKSLCFQFPAVYKNGITFVVSPLISLMEDQILSLQVANISACLLGTAQQNTKAALTRIFNNEYTLIYLTPEFCGGELGTEVLTRAGKDLNVVLIAIDEAHCISSWGRDFRTQYRKLGTLRTLLPDVPILAVTATATPRVQDDIVKSLNLRNPLRICSGFDRRNLYFEVHSKGSGAYADMKKIMEFTGTAYKFPGPTIVYCITRKQTEDVAQQLRSSGVTCAVYHAGLSIKVRKEAHELFVRDKIEVIVATIAFGMGIDKPDIRTVVHYGSSKSLESYYQEVGRAGRDGLSSKCILFFNNGDFATLRYLEEKSHSRPSASNSLTQIEHYLNTRDCRRRYILKYFQDKVPVDKTPQADCCDNCTQKLRDSRSDQEKYEGIDANGRYDFSVDSQIIIKLVQTKRLSTMTRLVLFLRGSNSAKLDDNLKKHPMFGVGQGKSEEWWKALVKLLVQEQYLEERKQMGPAYSYNVLKVTVKGENVLLPGSKVLLVPHSSLIKLMKTKEPEK